MRITARPQLLRTAPVLIGLAALAVPAAASAAPGVAFAPIGAEQTYAVPAGVDEVYVSATGGRGGAAHGAVPLAGGQAATVSGVLAVTAGSTLYVEVGGNGHATYEDGDSPFDLFRPGGWNGGANGLRGNGGFGAGGGGASDVRLVPRTDPGSVGSRLLVAGGGGGNGSVNDGPIARGGAAGQAGANALDAPGSPGALGGLGGQPGDAGAGGSPGGSVFLPGAAPTTPGASGTVDSGGEGSDSRTAGGGGGGGYGGGGGGGGGRQDPDTQKQGGGGGGGGGGSLVPSGGSFALAALTDVPSITVMPYAPSVALGAPVVFPQTQPLGLMSPGQTVTITNQGPAPLHVSGLEFVTGNADDFAVTSSTCHGAVAGFGSCRVVVRFVPQATGPRASALQVDSDDPSGPATVALSGTGGQLPTGPTGATGPAGTPGSNGATGATGGTGATGARGSDGAVGAQGPVGLTGAIGGQGAVGAPGPVGAQGPVGTQGAAGAAGAQGPAGKDGRDAKCTVKRVKGKQRITCKLVSVGGAKARATLTRSGRIYARGTVAALRSTRTLTPGRYTLHYRARGKAVALAVRIG